MNNIPKKRIIISGLLLAIAGLSVVTIQRSQAAWALRQQGRNLEITESLMALTNKPDEEIRALSVTNTSRVTVCPIIKLHQYDEISSTVENLDGTIQTRYARVNRESTEKIIDAIAPTETIKISAEIFSLDESKRHYLYVSGFEYCGGFLEKIG